ncbi:hypothetical protein ACFYZJ_10590 [Streptomyces sp. NPDC001848]|uniref:hypothetical protein n=1 Tax=Streptomyces sp. NPDC001848 TaxID=3364618 RepID=UPI0036839F67
MIERLAADDDYYVKLMLCEKDHAPHELLVEMLADWDGLSWGMLAYRRNFERPGLARFADNPNHGCGMRPSTHGPNRNSSNGSPTTRRTWCAATQRPTRACPSQGSSNYSARTGCLERRPVTPRCPPNSCTNCSMSRASQGETESVSRAVFLSPSRSQRASGPTGLRCGE